MIVANHQCVNMVRILCRSKNRLLYFLILALSCGAVLYSVFWLDVSHESIFVQYALENQFYDDNLRIRKRIFNYALHDRTRREMEWKSEKDLKNGGQKSNNFISNADNDKTSGKNVDETHKHGAINGREEYLATKFDALQGRVMDRSVERRKYPRLAERSIFPITPSMAISLFGLRMSQWERYEIRSYTKIWFLGLDANKTQFTGDKQRNFRFDEDNATGRYKLVIGDHMAYRYEIVDRIGVGSFGSVVLARDWLYPSGRLVALKVMHNKKNEKYTSRESGMMDMIARNAKKHDYFMNMYSTFNFRNHKCLVLERLGPTLYHQRHLVAHNMSLFRQFADDILHGLYYLHRMKVIHADLKPTNLMYIYGKTCNSSGQLLKIADFGMACIRNNKKYGCPSFHIQTMKYRAPEVMFQLPPTTQADMWSVGVTLAEMYLGYAPFPEKTEYDQLGAMMEVLGLPPISMFARSPRKIAFIDKNGSERKPLSKPLQNILKGIDESLLDLITRLLEYDPKVRITAEQALRHPFITYTATG